MRRESTGKQAGSPPALPKGMILLLVYFGISTAGAVFQLLQSSLVLGPFLITGAAFFSYALFVTAGSALTFAGILARKRWAWPLCIGWPIFEMTVSALAFGLFLMFPQQSTALAGQVSDQYIREHFKTIARFLGEWGGSNDASAEMTRGLVGLLMSWVVGVLVVVYAVRQKDYFRR